MKQVRTVSVVRDGKEHTYQEDVRLPRDADAAVWRLVLGITASVVAGAVAWSTVSIGSLLSYAAPAWTSYLVAGAFDLGWAVCMLLEWLARHDRDRAAGPRNAGWAFLVLSMALITLHGVMRGGVRAIAAGAAGALVALLGKALWHLAMRHTAVRLDAGTAAWLLAEAAELGAAQAVTARRRELARMRSRMAAERTLLGPDPDERTPELTAAVRPSAPVPDMDRWLAASGWTQETDGGWTDPDSAADPVRPTATRPVRSGPQRPVRGPLAVVRDLLADRPDMTTTEIHKAVQEQIPDANPESVTKAIFRARNSRTG